MLETVTHPLIWEKVVPYFKIDQRDLFFILKEQLHYGDLCRLPRYRDLSEAALDLLVKEALRFAREVVDPLNEVEESVRFEKGRVVCPPPYKTAFRRCGAAGWTAVARDPTYGGQGFPHMMRIVVNDLMYGACQAFNMAPSLSHGAGHLIESFGRPALKERFVPRLYNGIWAGTMCLTETAAGSNLAAIQTTARRNGGRFLISGEKCLISWGDHDLSENIIHLLLARIENAPRGIDGISLFVVPKIRVRSDGSPGEPNNVVCTGLEKKMGLHASPTTSLSFGVRGACVGHLCGEENRGLAHMFQMMNAARINAGVSSMSIAGTAYRNALTYARQRVQGREIADGGAGQVSLVCHPDVRRMLLYMKAAVDGMRSMIYTAAYWEDLSRELPPGREKDTWRNLLDFATPIVKAYCADTGFRVCETAMQCMGGYGYCRGYPVADHLCDVKIMSIYEGTNGIQSMDLMGRKMEIRGGACFDAFRRLLDTFCARCYRHPTLGERVQALAAVLPRLWHATEKMRVWRRTDPRRWAANTYPMLTAFGDVTMAWRLLDMARIAAYRGQNRGRKRYFYAGKIFQARHFVDTVLPHTLARLNTCLRPDRDVIDMPADVF